MEIPVVAPQDGTVASIDVAVGAAVENGDVLATMELRYWRLNYVIRNRYVVQPAPSNGVF